MTLGDKMRSSLAAMVLILFAMPVSAQTMPGWLADAKTGCRILYRGSPSPGLSISWTGPCRDNLAEGRGTLQWFRDGKPIARYEGEYRDGKLNGTGRYDFANGTYCEGEYRNDEINGRAFCTTKQSLYAFDTGSYDGEWRNGKPNGPGTFKTAGGDTYSGTWTNGCFQQGKRVAWLSATKKDCGFE